MVIAYYLLRHFWVEKILISVLILGSGSIGLAYRLFYSVVFNVVGVDTYPCTSVDYMVDVHFFPLEEKHLTALGWKPL